MAPSGRPLLAAASEGGYTRRAFAGSYDDAADGGDGGARTADPYGRITFGVGFLEAIMRLALHLQPQPPPPPPPPPPTTTTSSRDGDDKGDDSGDGNDNDNDNEIEQSSASVGGSVFVAPGHDALSSGDQTAAIRALGRGGGETAATLFTFTFSFARCQASVRQISFHVIFHVACSTCTV